MKIQLTRFLEDSQALVLLDYVRAKLGYLYPNLDIINAE